MIVQDFVCLLNNIVPGTSLTNVSQLMNGSVPLPLYQPANLTPNMMALPHPTSLNFINSAATMGNFLPNIPLGNMVTPNFVGLSSNQFSHIAGTDLLQS